jgi:hypothetical protein
VGLAESVLGVGARSMIGVRAAKWSLSEHFAARFAILFRRPAHPGPEFSQTAPTP